MAKDDDEITDYNPKLLLIKGIDIPNRTIYITGEIGEGSYKTLAYGLTLMEMTGDGNVTIIINSPGGDVYQGMAMVDLVLNSSLFIDTIGLGMVASAALLLFLTGQNRVVGRHTTILWHHVSAELPRERSHNIRVESKHITMLEHLMCRLAGERTLKPQVFWKKFGDTHDEYLTPSLAKSLGIVTQVFGEDDE